MFDFTQITLVIGKYNKNTHAIDMLGTGFLISNEGKVVTARHVVGNETNDLCVLLPHIPNITYIIHSGFISGYQNRYGDNLKPPTNVYHRMTA